MTTDRDLDDELREYLRASKSDRAAAERRERALEHITNQLVLIDRKIDVHVVEDREALKGIHLRLSGLEEDAEDTGVHNLEEAREAAKAWKTWLLGIAAAFIVSAGVGAVGYIVGSIGHPASASTTGGK